MRQWSVRYDSYMNVWVCVLQVKTSTHTFLSELMRRLQKLQTQTDDAVRSRHTTKLLRVSVCEILTVSKVVDCWCIQILCIIILISDVISCCDRKMKLMLLTEPHYVLSRWGIARPTLCVIMTSTRVKNKHTPLTHGILGKSTKQHDHDWHFIIINRGARVSRCAGLTVVYYLCGEVIPYRTCVEGNTVTLAQFKSLVTRRDSYRWDSLTSVCLFHRWDSHYFLSEWNCECFISHVNRFFFKRASSDFDCGVVYEEIREDETILPTYDHKIVAKVERMNEWMNDF